jgi:hypothetical protein
LAAVCVRRRTGVPIQALVRRLWSGYTLTHEDRHRRAGAIRIP